jgi:hypothetical protein
VYGGANLREVQKVMGYKSLKTTEGYAYAIEDGKRRVVAAFENSSHRLVTRQAVVTLLKAVNDCFDWWPLEDSNLQPTNYEKEN